MAPDSQKPLIPPLWVIPFGILAVSTSSIFIRFAQAENTASLVIAALRLSMASLILAPLALTRYRAELRQIERKEALLGAVSGLFLAVHFATWISSLEYTTVASSVVLVSTAPLWVAILAPIALKEPVTRLVVIGMIFTILGGIIVGLSDACTIQVAAQFEVGCPPLSEFVAGEAFLGDLLALVGALTAAGYLIIGRRLREKISLIPYIFVVYGVAAFFLVLIMASAGQSAFGHSPRLYFWVFLLALVPQLLGHSTYNWALRYLSAAYVSITLLGEPIGSAVLAYFILKETPTGLMLFGAILILVGIYIASLRTPAKKG